MDFKKRKLSANIRLAAAASTADVSISKRLNQANVSEGNVRFKSDILTTIYNSRASNVMLKFLRFGSMIDYL